MLHLAERQVDVNKTHQRVVPKEVPAMRRMSSNRSGVVKNQSMYRACTKGIYAQLLRK